MGMHRVAIQEAGWTQGSVWTGAENLDPTEIRSPDRPACSQSLYRLSYRPTICSHELPFFLLMADTVTSQNTDPSSWITVYAAKYALRNLQSLSQSWYTKLHYRAHYSLPHLLKQFHNVL
jgi:hypothetical protein